MILDKINKPEDLKQLSITEMTDLADEMRKFIIKKVNVTGGHMGPNLGIVETTIALHYVFNSPVDKIVFDVSHQCYPHKMLTGRKEGFTNPENYFKYTGYTAPEESSHDIFKVGHTSHMRAIFSRVIVTPGISSSGLTAIMLLYISAKPPSWSSFATSIP